jgi:hypothetical protein
LREEFLDKPDVAHERKSVWWECLYASKPRRSRRLPRATAIARRDLRTARRQAAARERPIRADATPRAASRLVLSGTIQFMMPPERVARTGPN